MTLARGSGLVRLVRAGAVAGSRGNDVWSAVWLLSRRPLCAANSPGPRKTNHHRDWIYHRRIDVLQGIPADTLASVPVKPTIAGEPRVAWLELLEDALQTIIPMFSLRGGCVGVVEQARNVRGSPEGLPFEHVRGGLNETDVSRDARSGKLGTSVRSWVTLRYYEWSAGQALNLDGANVHAESLGAGDSPGVRRGGAEDRAGVDGWTAGQQSMRRDGAAVVLQRPNEGIHAIKIARLITGDHGVVGIVDQIMAERGQGASDWYSGIGLSGDLAGGPGVAGNDRVLN